MNKRQKEKFVLDCCNQQSSRLQYYNSAKDINLVAFFAAKNNIRKSNHTKGWKKPKTREKRTWMLSPLITDKYKLKPSKTTKSLPPLSSQRKIVEPLDREELQALISKYREESKI